MLRVACALFWVVVTLFGRGVAAKSVCVVLQHASKLSGQLISVRGEWVENEEWAAVSGNCTFTLRAGGVDWPMSIELVNPKLGRANSAYRTSFQQAVSTIRGQREAGKKGTVLATFTGRLETKDLRGITMGDGTVVQFGFGHGGVFPARLVLESVRDVIVQELK